MNRQLAVPGAPDNYRTRGSADQRVQRPTSPRRHPVIGTCPRSDSWPPLISSLGHPQPASAAAPKESLQPLAVGGRLTSFADEWRSITQDAWTLGVVQQGLRLEFTEGCWPADSGVRVTPAPRDPDQRQVLAEEMNNLLLKGAIEPVPPAEIGKGYYSTYFLRPKKTGDLRPILNLKVLNRSMIYHRFRMETIGRVLSCLLPGDWMIVIDLKDAYFHIPVFLPHRKYLRFCFAGRHFQYRAMPFGLTSAPRIFTKVIAAVAQHLHNRGIRFFPYLDDFLMAASDPSELLAQAQYSMTLLQSLGFIINAQKSSLTPSQDQVFIGARIQTALDCVTLPLDRHQAILDQCALLLQQETVTARMVLRLLGLLAACKFVVPNCLLHMRPLQLIFNRLWKPGLPLDSLLRIPNEFRENLLWWTHRANLSQGIRLSSPPPQHTISCDASMEGWGATWEEQSIQGVWTDGERLLHINALELMAIFRAIQHWGIQFHGCSVRIESDNSTAVQYIAHQGGTKSSTLCSITLVLLRYCDLHQIQLIPVHVPGAQNWEADRLSRRASNTEWELQPRWARLLFAAWGTPMIDLFASPWNRQLPIFCSRVHYPETHRVNGLALSWENLTGYAFPPLALLPAVLRKVRQDQTETLILIAPAWDKRSWYPLLLDLLIDLPFLLPPATHCLRTPRGHLPLKINLGAWKLSGRRSAQEDFHRQLLTSSREPVGSPPRNATGDCGRPTSAGVLNGISIPFRHLSPMC